MADPNSAQTADHTQVKQYRNLFHPESIAVIGASADPLKPGGRVIRNIKNNGYTGRLWAVNPKAESIFGLAVYPSIQALPQPPDLAIVAIPSALVLSAVEALAQRKTGAVIVLTAGFGEKDDAGKQMEAELGRIAAAAGMTLIGPNCSGFLTPTYKGKFAGIVPRLPGGKVDFISGSGATVDYVMECATARGLSFGMVINLGNSVQMGVEDLLELYDLNYGKQSARILMLYMESVAKPAKLYRHARSLVEKGCALIGIKSGTTRAGEKAAASHTGALATSDTAVAALFEKAGIIRVSGRWEMIDVACVLDAVKGRPKGRKVCVITDAGGPGVMLSDELSRQGLELADLKPQTRAALATILPPESSTANPIDALPSRSAEHIRAAVDVLKSYERDNIHVMIVVVGDSGLSDNAPIYEAISDAMGGGGVPVIPVLSPVTSCRKEITDFINCGNTFFSDEVRLGRALGTVVNSPLPEKENFAPKGYAPEAVAAALGNHQGVLSTQRTRQVLAAAGFKLPDQVEIHRKDQLEESCERIGFPMVMKVIGPLHKTDAGGVKVGISTLAEAAEAAEALRRIPDAQGVLLQPLVDGHEVILGAIREKGFGHLVIFGLGGIYAEVMNDVNFALAPLGRDAAMRLVKGMRSIGILEGFRGEPGMDIDLLVEYIQRLGRLVNDFPQISELDLNPVKGFARELFVVDARIIVG